MPYKNSEEVEPKLDWKDAHLEGLVNQLLYNSGKMHEAMGWEQAGKYLKELAGKEFIAGNDDKARMIRDYGTFLLTEAKIRLAKANEEQKKECAGVWEEIERRFPKEKL